jgi:hypothetical protein
MSSADNHPYQWRGRMTVIKDTPDTFEFTLDGKRFAGGSESIDALCRSLRDQTATLVNVFAQALSRCLRCGSFGEPYRFGIRSENIDRDKALDLAAFAIGEGHPFIETMEPIAPNTFEVGLGS